MKGPIEESLWFTTRSALFRPGDEAWNAIAAYGEPLRRFVARRYRWLPEADRDDLVQEILIEIHRRLAARHDRTRGRFRALLQTVVKRRVADRLRARRPEALDDEAAAMLAAPDADEIVALDLETSLIEAVAACRDRFSQGEERDLDVLYALVDRIVHGQAAKEIARRTRASEDRVDRLLQRGRDAVFEALLARELALAHGDDRLARALAIFKASLRTPRATARLLAKEKDAKLRERLEEFLERFRSALRFFEEDGSARGEELRRGLDFIFEATKRAR